METMRIEVVATLRLSRTHSKVYLNYAEAQQ